MTKKKLTLQQIRALQREKAAKQKIAFLRSFENSSRKIDLRKKLSAKQIRKFENIFSEYTDLTSRPHKIVRARNKGNLDMLQNFAQHSDRTFNVAFVPVPTPNAKIRVKKDRIAIGINGVTHNYSPFNVRALIDDPEKEIRRAIDKFPDAKSFVIRCGLYTEWRHSYSRNVVIEKTIEMMRNYSAGGAKYEKRGPNSHFSNWLLGLETYAYESRGDFDQVRVDWKKERDKVLTGKKNERQRFYKMFGKRVNVFKK